MSFLTDCQELMKGCMRDYNEEGLQFCGLYNTKKKKVDPLCRICKTRIEERLARARIDLNFLKLLLHKGIKEEDLQMTFKIATLIQERIKDLRAGIKVLEGGA